jgi:hypothetical protein
MLRGYNQRQGTHYKIRHKPTIGNVARGYTSSSLPTQLNTKITKQLEIAIQHVLYLCSLAS